MAETVTIEEEVVEARMRLADLGRKTLHLGLGAAALAQDEVLALVEKARGRVNGLVEQTQQDRSGLVDKMVERGTTVEADGRQRVNELVSERKERVGKAQQMFEQRVEKVLNRMNVPTKSDIDKLEAKITKLTEKIEALNK